MKTSYNDEKDSSLFPVSIKSLDRIGNLEIPWDADYNREAWKIIEESELPILYKRLNKK